MPFRFMWPVTLLVTSLTACQSAGPRDPGPTPAEPPVAQAPEPTPQDRQPPPAGQPPVAATEKTAEPPAAPEPTPEDREKRPALPRYLRILERAEQVTTASIAASAEPPQKLELTTDNVAAFRLTREGLPLARQGSLVLRLDGQVFEWRENVSRIDFRRSRLGIWEIERVVRADRP